MWILLFIPMLSDTAPDFTLKDFDGVTYNLYSLLEEGPVILDFWATWCKPCLKAMPHLDSLYLKYRRSKLKVLGICIDNSKGVVRAKAIWNEKGFHYVPLWDSKGEVMKQYGVTGIPALFLIDTDRKIILEKKGFSEEMKEELEDSLRSVIVRCLLNKAKEGGNDEE